jgi:hypothetical protein
MAALETIGFAIWVQPANLGFVSIARSLPPRIAHPPPWLLSTESACPRTSVLDCIEEVCLDAPINPSNLRPFCRRKDI